MAPEGLRRSPGAGFEQTGSAGTRRLGRVVTYVAAVVVPTLLLGVTLYNNGWDPSYFAGFGEDDQGNRQIASELLDREPVLRPVVGHDGRFFFVQAVDPWIRDPSMYAQAIDRPVYRAQRSMYPILAGGLGLLGPEATLWGMVLLNLGALIVGSMIVAELFALRGFSPIFGLLFLANPGAWADVAVGGAGLLALCMLLAGVLAIEKGRLVVATVCFSAMALSREVMLLAVVALIWVAFRSGRGTSWLLYLAPFAVVTAWGAFVRMRLPPDPAGLSELGVPLAGWIESFGHWGAMPIDGLAAVSFLGMGIYLIAKAWSSTDRVVWAGVPFAILAMLLTSQVLSQRFNLARALAPITVSFFFLILDERRARARLRSNRRSIDA